MWRRVAVLAAQIVGRPTDAEDSNDKEEGHPPHAFSIEARAVPPQCIVISQEVQSALQAGRPVVALESTIITHGMPYPENLNTARAVERIIREGGATPATIAIIRGVPYVGLTDAQLQHLAVNGSKAEKCSRRDVGRCMALGLDGSTTVSATMLLAAAAGVHVFVTGGIGGVHRKGEVTMDISADLEELGKTPVLVVCAGAKSILDIPRTLEYLETKGVCAGALGTDEFPAFFTRSSGCRAPCRFDSEYEVAASFHAQMKLGLKNGMVLGVPIPSEHEAQGATVQNAIDRALKEAEDRKISGREITPFLLQRVAELSEGESLRSNVALIKHNASVGARIAAHLADLEK